MSSKHHQWHVLEEVPYRLNQSLSDLGGYDAVIVHRGRIDGVLDGLLEMFSSRPNPPVDNDKDMLRIYRLLRRYRQQLPSDLYKAHHFQKLCVAAGHFVDPGALPGNLRRLVNRSV